MAAPLLKEVSCKLIAPTGPAIEHLSAQAVAGGLGFLLVNRMWE